MTIVRPISDMQRNSAALTEEAMRTKEPIYLTRHGKPAVVLIDAEEYDREVALRDDIYEYEKRVLEHVEKGHQDILDGKGIPLEEVMTELEEKWGPDFLEDL